MLKMSAQPGTKWFCEICEVYISKAGKARHLKSIKHLFKMDNINFNKLPGDAAIDIKYRNKNMRYFLYSCRELGYEIISFRKTQYNLSKEIKTTDVFE